MDVASWLRYLVTDCKYKTPEALEIVRHLASQASPTLAHPSALEQASAADLSCVPKKLAAKLLRTAGLAPSKKRKKGDDADANDDAAARPAPGKRKSARPKDPVVKPPPSGLAAADLRGIRLQSKRSPVKIVLAAVAGQRVFDLTWEQAVAAGKAVSDAYAQMKARHLELSDWARPSAETQEPGGRDICIMDIDVHINAEGEVFFSGSTEAISPSNVSRYLTKALGEDYAILVDACELLVDAMAINDLKQDGFLNSVWERIRPSLPPGRAGWGYKGAMPLSVVLDERERYLAARAPGAADVKVGATASEVVAQTQEDSSEPSLS